MVDGFIVGLVLVMTLFAVVSVVTGLTTNQPDQNLNITKVRTFKMFFFGRRGGGLYRAFFNNANVSLNHYVLSSVIIKACDSTSTVKLCTENLIHDDNR